LRHNWKDAIIRNTWSVGPADLSNVAMLSTQEAEAGLLLVTGSSDINSSVVNDTIVQKNCRLHVRGHLLGNLTIEPGAKVIIEGSVAGKIINRGAGSLLTIKRRP